MKMININGGKEMEKKKNKIHAGRHARGSSVRGMGRE